MKGKSCPIAIFRKEESMIIFDLIFDLLTSFLQLFIFLIKMLPAILVIIVIGFIILAIHRKTQRRATSDYQDSQLPENHILAKAKTSSPPSRRSTYSGR